MRLLTILLTTILLATGCKTKEAEESSPVQQAATDKPQRLGTEIDLSQFDNAVPDACTLLDKTFVASVLGIDAESVNIKDGSNNRNNKARSCFYKWKSNYPNSGILIQAMKNPVEEEFPEWVTYFVKTKKDDGEKSFSSPGVVYQYTDWNVVGDEGAASPEAGKYIWRIGNEMAFMLAFNMDIDEAGQMAAAEKLANEVMRNIGND